MRLLVVDDEIVTTEVLREKLDRELLNLDEIYIAYNVAMAKVILKEKKIEIILCDIEMPQENGLEFLTWVRENKIETEFLFLTSYEKFEYAYGAVQKGAANYLLKPIDIPKINQALWTVTEKIAKEKKMADIREYWSYGKRKVIRYFWKSVVLEDLSGQKENINQEIIKLGLKDLIKEEYILAIFRLRKEAIFKECQSRNLNQFILDNIISEVLTLYFQMENIIHWEDGEDYYLVAISERNREETKEKITEIYPMLECYYDNPIYVVYISNNTNISEMGKVREEILNFDKEHVYDKGEIFYFSELSKDNRKLEKMTDQKFVLQCLEKGERVKLLEYLQRMVVEIKLKDCSLINMEYFQMDLIQTVSFYLHNRDMDLEFLFSDPVYVELSKKALTSEFAMIRWNTYYINKVFDSTLDREKGKGLVDIMVDYIRKNYENNITRNTLAELVHFSPEYVGKVFKKEIGVGISDYINNLRIQKAKSLLASTNYKIIDIALMVGYDNMPYFSSIFKKYVGVSPAEYKRQNGKIV